MTLMGDNPFFVLEKKIVLKNIFDNNTVQPLIGVFTRMYMAYTFYWEKFKM